MPGTLYLVATPIGNLEDITLRALRVLGEVDLIACEDTRLTRRLLYRHHIATPATSYHEHNERTRSAELVRRLEEGSNIALVTDAGMPAISDPGMILIREAISHGITIIPLPGPSAPITALAASGLLTDDFYFAGFLPAKRNARKQAIIELRKMRTTIILFEAPHRIRETLAGLAEVLGDLPAAIAREISKVHEEIIRGSLAELRETLRKKEPRGEFVLLVDTRSINDELKLCAASKATIAERIRAFVENESISTMDAIKRVARELGLSKKSVYAEYLKETGKS